MEYIIKLCNGTEQKFDNIDDFLEALSELALAYAENGETRFEVKI